METVWQDRLRGVREAASVGLPPSTAAAYDRDINDLSRTGIIDRALKVGDNAPDFTYTTHRGHTARLSDRLASGPVVVSFFRGTWCPFCAFELESLQGALDQITAQGGSLIAVSPQAFSCDGDRVDCGRLGFDIAVDAHNEIARQFGVVYHVHDEIQSIYRDLGLDLPEINGDDSFDLPVPATYVVDASSVIQLAFVDPDYTRRLDPAEIIATLRRLKTAA